MLRAKAIWMWLEKHSSPLNPFPTLLDHISISWTPSASSHIFLDNQPAHWCVHFCVSFLFIVRFCSVVFDDQECCVCFASTLRRHRRCPSSRAPSQQSQILSPSSSCRCPWCRHRWSQSELWRHMYGRQKSTEEKWVGVKHFRSRVNSNSECNPFNKLTETVECNVQC